jgi:hypothetical protein
MKNKQVTVPQFKENTFVCPHCGALSVHDWVELQKYRNGSFIHGLDMALCINPDCLQYSLWKDQKMIFPNKVIAPKAHIDMPENVKEIFNEAREVMNVSPRAAAALLRVSLEKLTEVLGEKEGSLNTRIGNLSSQGLPQRVVNSLDIVRITANEGGSHSGAIDLTGEDNSEAVSRLFWLVNLIVEKTITEPKEIGIMFEGLPENKKAGVKQRDNN